MPISTFDFYIIDMYKKYMMAMFGAALCFPDVHVVSVLTQC